MLRTYSVLVIYVSLYVHRILVISNYRLYIILQDDNFISPANTHYFKKCQILIFS